MKGFVKLLGVAAAVAGVAALCAKFVGKHNIEINVTPKENGEDDDACLDNIEFDDELEDAEAENDAGEEAAPEDGEDTL